MALQTPQSGGTRPSRTGLGGDDSPLHGHHTGDPEQLFHQQPYQLVSLRFSDNRGSDIYLLAPSLDGGLALQSFHDLDAGTRSPVIQQLHDGRQPEGSQGDAYQS